MREHTEHAALREAIGQALSIAGFLVLVGGAGIVVAMLVSLLAGDASIPHVESAVMAGTGWGLFGLAAYLIGRRIAR